MNDPSHMYNIESHTQIQFLEQLSDEEFWDYAQILATQENSGPTTDEEALECETEHGHYLLPLQTLCEVVPPPHKLTLLPLCPPWLLGITAWRGHVLPVVDLALYFIFQETNELDTTYPRQPASHHANSMLLILDDGNSLLGIQVMAVGSTITLEQTQLASPEETPSWYPRHMLTMLFGAYNGSVVLNPQVMIAEMIQRIKVSAAYE